MVGKPEHIFVVGIVSEADKVAAQLLRPSEQSAIVFRRERAATAKRRFFVHGNSTQKDWLAVQKDLGSVGFNGAEADFVSDVVISSRNCDAVKFRIFWGPQLQHFRRELEHCTSRCIHSRGLLRLRVGDFDSD